MLDMNPWWLLPAALIVGSASARFAERYADRVLRGAPLNARTLIHVVCRLYHAEPGGTASPALALVSSGILLIAWWSLLWSATAPVIPAEGGPVFEMGPVTEVAMRAVAGPAHAPEPADLTIVLRAAACVILLNLALIDARTGFLPDALTLPCLYGGLLAALLGYGVPLHDAVAGALLGYGFLWIFNAAYRRCRGRNGMGGGDMKLLAALGAWLGWAPLPAVLAAACIGGVFFSLLRPGPGKWSRPLAFGPFLVAAGSVGLVAPPVVQFPF